MIIAHTKLLIWAMGSVMLEFILLTFPARDESNRLFGYVNEPVRPRRYVRCMSKIDRSYDQIPSLDFEPEDLLVRFDEPGLGDTRYPFVVKFTNADRLQG